MQGFGLSSLFFFLKTLSQREVISIQHEFRSRVGTKLFGKLYTYLHAFPGRCDECVSEGGETGQSKN
jgi:hypothetical protein